MSVGRGSRSFVAVMATALSVWPGAALGQSVAPSGVPPSGASTVVMSLPPEAAPLAAGRYVSGVGTGTSVTLDLADDGWTGAGGEMVALDRDVAGDMGELFITTFDSALADPCTRDVAVTQPLDNGAQAFTDWLLAQPWAEATGSETTLGGLPAMQVDITALKPACPDQPMFVWTYFGGGPYRLYPTEAVRVIAQDRGDDLVLVTAETVKAESLPAFLDSAMPVIDSMTFGAPIAPGSAEPAPSAGQG